MDLYLGEGKCESLDINNNQGVVRIMSERERITKTYCSFFAVLEELEEDSSDKVKGQSGNSLSYGKCVTTRAP